MSKNRGLPIVSVPCLIQQCVDAVAHGRSVEPAVFNEDVAVGSDEQAVTGRGRDRLPWQPLAWRSDQYY